MVVGLRAVQVDPMMYGPSNALYLQVGVWERGDLAKASAIGARTDRKALRTVLKVSSIVGWNLR